MLRQFNITVNPRNAAVPSLIEKLLEEGKDVIAKIKNTNGAKSHRASICIDTVAAGINKKTATTIGSTKRPEIHWRSILGR
jgi:hypothetical protein